MPKRGSKKPKEKDGQDDKIEKLSEDRNIKITPQSDRASVASRQSLNTEISNEKKVVPFNPIYENLLNHVPSECITVPIIMECMLEQVIANVDKPTSSLVDLDHQDGSIEPEIDRKPSEFNKFGKPDWGNTLMPSGLPLMSKRNKSQKQPLGPIFTVPLYIKNGDFASIRSCHLSEVLASHIASTQVVGDLLNIQRLLWEHTPEFNKGLYMKLLGNLNQFMYFLPPNSIKFEDMFFILHLLMAGGVEVELQKRSEKLRLQKAHQALKDANFSSVAFVLSKDELGMTPVIEGTNLAKDHNYLAINEITGLHFIMAPSRENELTIAQLGHSKATEGGKDLEALFTENSETNLEEDINVKNRSVTYEGENLDPNGSTEEEKSRKNSDRLDHLMHDSASAAEIIAVDLIEDAAEIAVTEEENVRASQENIRTSFYETQMEKEEDEEEEEEEEEEEDEEMYSGPEIPEQMIPKIKKFEDYYFGAGKNDPNSKKFIACEEQWFKNLDDFSVFKSLLECPALLAINDSGALDLSQWVNTYLTSTGEKHESGDGILIGRLKDWNYVEELVPVQTIQLLNESMNNYLSMQRMYCPFYDTLLFIFNNPVPSSLKSKSKFHYELKTIPDMNYSTESIDRDDPVFQWFMQIERDKEVIDSLSATTLIKIIPEEQWLLVPSIKYMLFQEQVRLDKELALQIELAQRKSIPSLLEENSSKESDPTSPPLDLENLNDQTLKELRKSKMLKKSRTSKDDLKSKTGESKKDKNSKTEDEVKSKRDSKTFDTTADGEKKIKKRKSKDLLELNTSNSKVKKGKGTKLSSINEEKILQGEEDDCEDEDGVPSLNLADTILRNRKSNQTKKKLKRKPMKFDCYDLGKSVIVATSEEHLLYPMDGTVIQYDISRIEPGSKTMQLKIMKNGHQSFFYPCFRRDMDMNKESYVVCPYFHMVHVNGTIFAFQDLRAGGNPTPYSKDSVKSKMEESNLFSYEKVVFGTEAIQTRKSRKLIHSAPAKVENRVNSGEKTSEKGGSAEKKKNGSMEKDKIPSTPGQEEKDKQPKRLSTGEGNELKKSGSDEKGKGDIGSLEVKAYDGETDIEDTKEKEKKKKIKKKDKNKDPKEKSTIEEKTKEEKIKEKQSKEKFGEGKKEPKEKGEGKSKDDKSIIKKKGKKGKKDSTKDITSKLLDIEEEENEEEEEHNVSTIQSMLILQPTPPNTEASDQNPGYSADGARINLSPENPEWKYSDSELSDDDGSSSGGNKDRTYFAPNWENAESMVEPMTHSLKITLPSGLLIHIDDVKGPPISREVKQSYSARGSATSRIESSRYYTMNGSVVKFMLNGTIQILTARGVTTTIRELAASSQRETENIHEVFEAASNVRIFNGEVILPNGDFWSIVDGKKEPHDPIYVFTSGPLPDGEIFRRRQDGVIYLHRHDGTTITHYPDGTRFTTRMVIQTEPVEDFEDWVFVGLKYMVEHTNYSAVIFNTLSRNVHLRLPYGDWVRVFYDGTIKISTSDKYIMDVDKNRAVFSFPPCTPNMVEDIPNLTSIKLWHNTPENILKTIVEPKVDPIHKIDHEAKQDTEALPQTGSKNALTDESNSSGNPKSGKQNPKDKPKSKEKGLPKVRPLKSLTSPNTLNGKRLKARMEKRKIIPSETLDGEPLEEEEDKSFEDEEGYTTTEEEGEGQGEETDGSRENLHGSNFFESSKGWKKFEIHNFLKFTDGSLLCKAIDSWDNRFALDMNGETIVDKSPESEEKMNTVEEHLIKSLSEHCQLPTGYLSGILKMTSSENLSTAAKRIKSLQQPKVDMCGKLPPTKMFVLKRDMSGYQYMKHSEVDLLISQSKTCRESMVIVDPLPNREPRKFITIMEPVNQSSKPHGMWTNAYREPVFRPQKISNKNLTISKPRDLRWFGYVLMGAHEKRPKFFPNPREQYLIKRKHSEINKRKLSEEAKRHITHHIQPIEETEEEEEEVEEAESVIESEVHVEEDKHQKKHLQKSKEVLKEAKSKTDKKQKKDKEVKEPKSSHAKVDPGPRESHIVDSHSNAKTLKGIKSGGPKKHNKNKVKEPFMMENVDAPETFPELAFPEEDEEEEEEEAEEEKIVVDEVKVEEGGGDKIRLDEVEIGEYPEDVADLEGMYEDQEPVKIVPQCHIDICTEKKAVVVRTLVEIPQIDETLQRALLAASVSYGQAMKGQMKVFESSKIDDPRSEDERERQRLVKQQLIEHNLSDMHLLEQQPGQVLRFHF